MATVPPSLNPTSMGGNLTALMRQLVRAQLIDENALTQATDAAKRNGVSVIAQLIEAKQVRAADVARVASQELRYPLVDISVFELETAPVKLVSEQLIRKHQALPLSKRGTRLFLAMADPSNLQALEEIKFQSGLNAEPIVAAADLLARTIDKAFDRSAENMVNNLDADLDNLNIESGDEVGQQSGAGAGVSANTSEDEAPVVRFVNKILLDAINKGASDIHFEPYEHFYRVRFRQDGILREIVRPPLTMRERIAARLKVMSQMDIAERRVPQDGRIKLHISSRRAIDFRVNSLPTLFGEKVVLRILDPSSAKLGIDALGYEAEQKERFMNALHKPQGMVLVTGPTGSGKTVSLYTGLNILNTPDVNISTAEDPVEINLGGINQVNVNVKTGMTFANALRAFLRQDPDVIMVGEIRDLETAEIAIKAAQTGHMVLSTLHTNSAPQTLTRLMNMGVAAYNIASSVTLIIAQRLARRLCPSCKEETRNIPAEELIRLGFKAEELDSLVIYKPVGCDQCNEGYKGRVGIYEVMPISEEMGRLIMSGGNAIQIADQAQREGINNLRQSGLNKVRMGLTSLEEVNRVTKE